MEIHVSADQVVRVQLLNQILLVDITGPALSAQHLRDLNAALLEKVLVPKVAVVVRAQLQKPQLNAELKQATAKLVEFLDEKARAEVVILPSRGLAGATGRALAGTLHKLFAASYPRTIERDWGRGRMWLKRQLAVNDEDLAPVDDWFKDNADSATKVA